MAKELPFCVCVVCEHIQETRERSHVVREGFHVIVIPADEEHDWAGFTACHEHYADYRRVRPVGADVMEEPAHATH